MWTSSSACSSGCIHRKISPARAPALRSSSGSSAGMADAYGRKGRWGKAQRCFSHCRCGNPVMSDTWGTLTVSGQAGNGDRGYDDPALAGADAPPEVPSSDLTAAAGQSGADAWADTPDPQLTRRFRQYAMWCGVLVIAIGCLALLGWLTGTTVITSISLHWATMKANTAIGLIAAGSSLCLNISNTGDRTLPRLMSRFCAVFVIVLATATLLEYVLNVDLGIDQMLVAEPRGTVRTAHPGRMAPLTVLDFELCGLALLTMTSER